MELSQTRTLIFSRQSSFHSFRLWERRLAIIEIEIEITEQNGKMCLYVYADMEMYSFAKMRWKMYNITTIAAVTATAWLLLCHSVQHLWALIRLSGSSFPFIHAWNVAHRFCHSYNRYFSSWWAFNILQPTELVWTR